MIVGSRQEYGIHICFKLAITEDDYYSVKISLSQLFPNLPSELDDHDISVLGLICIYSRQLQN